MAHNKLLGFSYAQLDVSNSRILNRCQQPDRFLHLTTQKLYDIIHLEIAARLITAIITQSRAIDQGNKIMPRRLLPNSATGFNMRKIN
jgi:hypothetical protein